MASGAGLHERSAQQPRLLQGSLSLGFKSFLRMGTGLASHHRLPPCRPFFVSWLKINMKGKKPQAHLGWSAEREQDLNWQKVRFLDTLNKWYLKLNEIWDNIKPQGRLNQIKAWQGANSLAEQYWSLWGSVHWNQTNTVCGAGDDCKE